MKDEDAVNRFAALAHSTRLSVFKALIAEGPEGMPAGRLATLLEVSPSNLSAHLAILSQAGLLTMRAEGRARIYAVDLDQVGDLVNYLVADCCKGHPEVCSPVMQAMGRRC
ncbi:MAG: ArsR/SmtB family transcription factor [Oceanicaulis sp.]